MRLNFLFVLVVMVCCLALAGPAVGGMWRPMGPYGDMVTGNLAIAPEDHDVMFVCCNGGLYKSLNGGAGWQLASRKTHNCVSAARAGQDLVVASTTWDVYLSVDGGFTWQNAPNLPFSPGVPPRVDVNSVAIDPRNPEVVWVCTTKGICLSTSSGNEWRWRNDGLPENFDAGFVRFDLSDPSRVYLCSYQSGIYRSENFGGDWEQVSDLSHLRDLAVDPQDPQTLYAATSGGVLKSVNGGANWESKNAGLSELRVDKLAVCQSEPNVLYCASGANFAAVYVSEDGAESWQRRDEGVPRGVFSPRLIVSPVSADVAYVGTPFGVYRTVDRGLSWSAANLGIACSTVSDMAFHPNHPGTIFVATSGGLFRTTDNGESWDLMAMEGKSAQVRMVALDPLKPSTVYASVNDTLIKSVDGGDIWAPLYQTEGTILELVIDPLDTQTMYMTTALPGLYKSQDGGYTWTPATSGVNMPGMVLDLVVKCDPKDPSVVWLGINGFPGGAVYRTEDGAESWQLIIAHATCDMVISPAEDTVYLAGPNGLVIGRSDGNGGYTFQEEAPGLLDKRVNSLSMAPDNPNVLYVGTGMMGETSLFAGLYKTTNGGESWTRLSCEAMVGTVCNYVATDPFTPNEVWAGFIGNALLKYMDEPGPPVELSLSTDQSLYSAGDEHTAMISATNTGGDIDVDLYIAIMLPDGSLWFWPEFISEMSPGFSMTPMPRGFSMSDVVFFRMELPGGLPTGTYTWFAMFFGYGSQDAVSNLARSDWTFE